MVSRSSSCDESLEFSSDEFTPSENDAKNLVCQKFKFAPIYHCNSDDDNETSSVSVSCSSDDNDESKPSFRTVFNFPKKSMSLGNLTRSDPKNGHSKYQSIRDRSPSPPFSSTPPPLPQNAKTSTKTESSEVKLYPNCDASVWLRSCEHEIIEPLTGKCRGSIPHWIKGSLLRNGPGSLRVGQMEFNHLFDSSALVHRFAIADGQVTYQCRFLQTDTYKRNQAAQRIVVTQFGTSSVPDPCHSIFQRFSAIFKPGDMSDNAMISIYPFGDEYFAFTEYPVIHSINVETLGTERRLDMADYIGILSHTSHPHILADGTVYNLGMTVTKHGPCYNIVCFPRGNSMFEDSHIVATLPARWKFHPGYMHTFAMTEHYFVIVEQPLSISVPEMLRSQFISSKPLASHFKWFPEQRTNIYLLCRATGHLKFTFEAEAFFYLHIINAYEDCDHVVVDICCYKDPSMLDCMYTAAMRSMQTNPDYARMFRAQAMRFVLPLWYVDRRTSRPTLPRRSMSVTNLWSRLRPKVQRSNSEQQYCHIDDVGTGGQHESVPPDATNMGDIRMKVEATDENGGAENLIRLKNTAAKAYATEWRGKVLVVPEVLCDLGCETPRIFYESYLGKKYRYFYAISADVDAKNPGALIKVDVETKTRRTWCEVNCYPSEPIFIEKPYAEAEDDGIVLAAMVWGNGDENRVGLLVLCARTWTEIGRCEFETPGPVPKCLHGWFAAAKD